MGKTALALSSAASDLELPARPDVMTEQELGRYAADVDNFVDFARNELSRNEQRLGVVLLMIRNERLYELLGHTSFESYLASKGMSKTNAYLYLRQAEIYLIPLEPPASPTQVAAMGLVKSLVIGEEVRGKTQEEAAEYVADAIELSEGDLRTRVEERNGKVPDGMTMLLRSIRSQLNTYVLRLTFDKPEKLIEELGKDAVRWRQQIILMRKEKS
jgi:hypothetical protein